MAARVHALAKHPKSSKGLYFPIASDQRPQHSVAKTWSRCRSGAWLSSFVDCIHVKRINGCYASCRGKSLSCGTTHSTGCTRKSSGIQVGDMKGSGHGERRKKALLPMYFSEGGMASSTRAAQFMKALTRIVWSRRQENFSEASAVHKGEFRNFFNVGVAEVNTLKQSATLTRMRSNSCKILRESKCGNSRRAKTAWCQLTGPGLQC